MSVTDAGDSGPGRPTRDVSGRAASGDPSSRLSDLVPNVVAGETAATRTLLTGLSPRVSGVVRRILGVTHPEVADATQESMVAIVKALPAYRGEASVVSYATRITVCTCLRIQRRRRRKDEVEEGVALQAPEHHRPVDPALAARRREAMREILSTLPSEQAEALTMRVVLGWSLPEIAAAMEVPVNTVRSRVRLAKEALRNRIETQPRWAELLGGE